MPEHVPGLPIETALDYAKQIADALEYAHERGVIHRDLKPANVKITPEGVVKIPDFGLAKAIEGPGSAADDPSISPTLTLGATRAGVILETAACRPHIMHFTSLYIQRRIQREGSFGKVCA